MEELTNELANPPSMGEEALAYVPLPSRARDLAFSGAFGAAAFLLPTLFHLVHLGHVFMPMYLPLVALAFLVRPSFAAATAILVPLLSSLLTGMPPFFPPVAFLMAAELAAMSLVIAWGRARFPSLPTLALLLPALCLGRILYVAMAWGSARMLTLPARFVAGLSLIAGWPGLLLMALTVPTVVAGITRAARRS